MTARRALSVVWGRDGPASGLGMLAVGGAPRPFRLLRAAIGLAAPLNFAPSPLRARSLALPFPAVRGSAFRGGDRFTSSTKPSRATEGDNE